MRRECSSRWPLAPVGAVIAPAPAATSDRLHLGSGQDEPDYPGDGWPGSPRSREALAAAGLDRQASTSPGSRAATPTGRAPAFSRFVMIGPVQTTRPRSGEHGCFCNGQGPQGRPQRSGHRPNNEKTPRPRLEVTFPLASSCMTLALGIQLRGERFPIASPRRAPDRLWGSPSVGSVHRTTSHPSGGASRPAPRRFLDETLCEVLARHSIES